MTPADSTTVPPDGPRKRWLKRAGVLGFMFFFLKGLAWLAAPLILLESCTP